MPKQNFELVTEMQMLIRRDFEPDTALLADMDPNDANPVLMGEFLGIVAGYKAGRVDDVAGEHAPADLAPTAGSPRYALFVERGRYDTRSIAGNKVTLLWSAGYEADTLIWGDAAGGRVPQLGDPLYVAPCDTDGLGSPSHDGIKMGLSPEANGALVANKVVHGFVTKAPVNNVGKLRFVCVAP